MHKIKNISIALGFVLFISTTVKAQVIDPRFEALFIYNFTKYIEWSKVDGHADFIIGILGKGDIVSELELMASQKSVGTRKIIIKAFDNIGNLEHCHVLFITKNKSAQLSDAKQKLMGMSTLYITESPGMAQMGSGINLISKVNKVVFEINTKNIKDNNLKVSSVLLNLADKVFEN